MQLSKYIAIGSATLAVISVFLPWLEVNSSVNFMGSSSSYSSGGISGLYSSGGIFGIIVAISGMIMAIKKIKYAFVTGAVNFINGLGYMLGWFSMNSGGSFNSSFGDSTVKASVDPQIGLYLFVLASLVYVIFTLPNLKGKKVE